MNYHIVTVESLKNAKIAYQNAHNFVNKERENCRVCLLYQKGDHWNCDSDLCHELTSIMEDYEYSYRLLFKKYQAQQAQIAYRERFNN